ncbi:hypothetical protein WMO79_01005 [Micrococcaceae bacterium Sec7.4]
MIQLFMAAALFLLAAARLPARRRNGKDTVFLAGIFAGASSLLLSPMVYFAVDPLIGGVNVAKLALNSFMIVGLWYLRAAVLAAVSPHTDRRPDWLRTLPLTVSLTLQALFFVLAGFAPTEIIWGKEDHNPVFAVLFSLVMLFFIAWSSGQITWTCFRYVPRMRKSFRIGFSMVGLGTLLSVFVISVMIFFSINDVTSWVPRDSPLANLPFHELEMIVVVLVGVGLTIPPVAGHIDRRRAPARLTRTIEKVQQIRGRVLAEHPTDRMLKVNEDATPQERLHRMIVEIWDAELAAATMGSRVSALNREDRDYMLLVESDFDLGRTR